jgi:hypothetical protein
MTGNLPEVVLTFYMKVCSFPRRFDHLAAGVKSGEQGLTKTTEEVRLSRGGVYFNLGVLLFAWPFVFLYFLLV